MTATATKPDEQYDEFFCHYCRKYLRNEVRYKTKPRAMCSPCKDKRVKVGAPV